METLSYYQLMMRNMELEQEVLRLREQLRREQDYALASDIDRMEMRRGQEQRAV